MPTPDLPNPVAAAATVEPLRSVHTTSLGELLRQANCSLLISTYQAGKLIIARAEPQDRGGAVNTHFRNFDTPMGLALDGHGRLAIGTRVHLWEFHDQPDVARALEPAGTHDACFLPRQAVVTGQIGVHDVAWAGE